MEAGTRWKMAGSVPQQQELARRSMLGGAKAWVLHEARSMINKSVSLVHLPGLLRSFVSQ